MPAKENNRLCANYADLGHSAKSVFICEIKSGERANEMMRGIKRNVSLDFRTEIEATLSSFHRVPLPSTSPLLAPSLCNTYIQQFPSRTTKERRASRDLINARRSVRREITELAMAMRPTRYITF